MMPAKLRIKCRSFPFVALRVRMTKFGEEADSLRE
jgi:hypothetical protein